MRAAALPRLLPLVRDQGWFFDTELLVTAQRAGLRIHEVPVDWADDPDSRVDIVSTALEDLKGIARLASGTVRRALPGGRRVLDPGLRRCCSWRCAVRSAPRGPTRWRWR